MDAFEKYCITAIRDLSELMKARDRGDEEGIIDNLDQIITSITEMKLNI